MWIGHNEGWLSIVRHREMPEHLLVRARERAHIESLFPDEDIYVIEHADYPYRSNVLRTDVGTAIANALMDIEYDNFKNSVKEIPLSKAYNDIWSVMFDYGLPHRPQYRMEY